DPVRNPGPPGPPRGRTPPAPGAPRRPTANPAGFATDSRDANGRFQDSTDGALSLPDMEDTMTPPQSETRHLSPCGFPEKGTRTMGATATENRQPRGFDTMAS